jgi:hypothetical protein
MQQVCEQRAARKHAVFERCTLVTGNSHFNSTRCSCDDKHERAHNTRQLHAHTHSLSHTPRTSRMKSCHKRHTGAASTNNALLKRRRFTPISSCQNATRVDYTSAAGAAARAGAVDVSQHDSSLCSLCLRRRRHATRAIGRCVACSGVEESFCWCGWLVWRRAWQ